VVPLSLSTLSTYRISASRRIEAPAATVYAILADYREGHPRILPPAYFGPITVEEGGRGAGTVITVEIRAGGRRRAMRGVVSEPEPGRVLLERYPETNEETSFTVVPEGPGACTLTITTTLPGRRGLAGRIERPLARWLLTRIYREELARIAAYAPSVRGGEGAPTG